MNQHPLQPYWTEKAKDAMREKAYSGVMPGCAPLGYRNATVDSKSVIVHDEDVADKVKQLFLLACIGKHSLRQILSKAEEVGLRSRNGKPLGVSALHAIITNPFYFGMLRYKNELIQGAHTPLISKACFEAVGSRLRKRR